MYMTTIEKIYWKLIPLFGKNWKSHPMAIHSQVIQEINKIGKNIEIQVPKDLDLIFNIP